MLQPLLLIIYVNNLVQKGVALLLRRDLQSVLVAHMQRLVRRQDFDLAALMVVPRQITRVRVAAAGTLMRLFAQFAV